MCDICNFVRNTPKGVYASHNIKYYRTSLPDTTYSARMCGNEGNVVIKAIANDGVSGHYHQIQIPITHCPFCGEKLSKENADV